MSLTDDLEIRNGGIIAVDTDHLRDAAARLAVLADDCDVLRSRLSELAGVLRDADVWAFVPTAEVTAAGAQAASLAGGVRSMAETYDLVELWIQIEVARSSDDSARVAVLAALSGQLIAAHPDAAARAAGEVAGWVVGHREGVVAQLGGSVGAFGYLMPGWSLRQAAGLVGSAVALLGTIAIDGVGRGAVAATPLRGDPRPVTVTPLTSTRGTVPTGLADMATRIPRDDARVRVEKYTMADGSTQFVAYVAGTQIGADADEPWDMQSNVELYTGSRSASYDATMAALEAAGAHPGDTVHLAGHSQGAMVASHVATSGVYEVPALVTLGDPVQVAVGPGTLSVDIRHGDDPVSALAAGGHPAAVGSADSFVAGRTSAASLVDGEMPMQPHALTRYVETAALLDRSSDPRMTPVRSLFEGLGQAVSVQVTTYGATRPS